MTHTFTRTHVITEFANPFLVCEECGKRATGWHNDDHCGCDASCWNEPCGHRAGARSVCPSWSPVDGCCCLEHLGRADHAPTTGEA